MNLTLKQKAAFGIGAVGKDMVYALSASYVMYYYQDVLGLSATFVGLILMILCPCRFEKAPPPKGGGAWYECLEVKRDY